MPEVWLNYGPVDVVLNIRAENLDRIITKPGPLLGVDYIEERLQKIDLTSPQTLVLLQDTVAIRSLISILYNMCEKRSLPFPKIVANRQIVQSIKSNLPQGSAVQEYDKASLDSGMIFVSEISGDGLFGYETVSTMLLRMFGPDAMLDAYAARDADTPMPSHFTKSYHIANEFVEKFDILSINLTSRAGEILDVHVGHPSACNPSRMTGSAYPESGNVKTIVGSTGASVANDTLAHALSSLWTMYKGLRSGGQAVLLAECASGLGSPAIRGRMEGKMSPEYIHDPPVYAEGMEDLLFLDTVSRDIDVVLVSALPEFYVSKLNMSLALRAQDALDAVLQQNPRRKILVLSDASGAILWNNSRG